MDTYQGKCRYCGQEQPVMAASQEAADDHVSDNCDCGQASVEQKKSRLMAEINRIAKASENPAFDTLDEDKIRLLRQGGRDVLEGMCQGAAFEFHDSKVRIWNANGKYKVKRTGSREETAEIE